MVSINVFYVLQLTQTSAFKYRANPLPSVIILTKSKLLIEFFTRKLC